MAAMSGAAFVRGGCGETGRGARCGGLPTVSERRASGATHDSQARMGGATPGGGGFLPAKRLKSGSGRPVLVRLESYAWCLVTLRRQSARSTAPVLAVRLDAPPPLPIQPGEELLLVAHSEGSGPLLEAFQSIAPGCRVRTLDECPAEHWSWSWHQAADAMAGVREAMARGASHPEPGGDSTASRFLRQFLREAQASTGETLDAAVLTRCLRRLRAGERRVRPAPGTMRTRANPDTGGARTARNPGRSSDPVRDASGRGHRPRTPPDVRPVTRQVPPAPSASQVRPLPAGQSGIDPVRDSLCGVTKLLERPLRRIVLRRVAARAVVDQPLDQRLGKLQLVGRDRDEAVAKCVVPERLAAMARDGAIVAVGAAERLLGIIRRTAAVSMSLTRSAGRLTRNRLQGQGAHDAPRVSAPRSRASRSQPRAPGIADNGEHSGRAAVSLSEM